MTKLHISLDIETWGTTPGSDIRSIGAVVFDPTDSAYEWVCFYIATHNLNIVEDGITRRTYPLTRDAETVKWWNEQSSAARAAFDYSVDIKEGIQKFIAWYNNVTKGTDPKDVRLWCKGSHFDAPLLEYAIRAVGESVPWRYSAPRDLRVALELANITSDEQAAYFEGTTPHHALDDAIAQAKMLVAAYERLGLTNGKET